MRNYQTEATVLRRHSVGEADRIIIVVSPRLGKLTLKARGVRKGSSKLAGHLEPFCKVNLQLARGHQLDVITGAQVSEVYDFDQSDIERMALGYLLLEVTDKLTADRQPNQPSYQLLEQCLRALANGFDCRLLRHYFFVKALTTVGHQPNLDNIAPAGRYYLLLDEGRIGSDPNSSGIPIDERIIKLWRMIYVVPLASLARVEGVEAVLTPAQELIEKFYQYHIDLKFRSEAILQS